MNVHGSIPMHIRSSTTTRSRLPPTRSWMRPSRGEVWPISSHMHTHPSAHPPIHLSTYPLIHPPLPSPPPQPFVDVAVTPELRSMVRATLLSSEAAEAALRLHAADGVRAKTAHTARTKKAHTAPEEGTHSAREEGTHSAREEITHSAREEGTHSTRRRHTQRTRKRHTQHTKKAHTAHEEEESHSTPGFACTARRDLLAQHADAGLWWSANIEPWWMRRPSSGAHACSSSPGMM